MRRFNADEPGDLPLGRPRDFDGGELRSWALARCAGLIAAHGVPVIMDAFDAATEQDAFDALEQYARTCLQRFDDAPDDTVARVARRRRRPPLARAIGGYRGRPRARLTVQRRGPALPAALRRCGGRTSRGPSVAWSRRRARPASSTTPKSTNRGGRRGLDSCRLRPHARRRPLESLAPSPPEARRRESRRRRNQAATRRGVGGTRMLLWLPDRGPTRGRARDHVSGLRSSAVFDG